MKRALIFTILLFVIFSFIFADGFLYPTESVLKAGQVNFSLENMNVSAGAGLGSNLEIGGSLFSYYKWGVYLKVQPFRNIAMGVSYLPFKLCLLGPCKTQHVFNFYGVYEFENSDFNANVGAKFMLVGDSKMMDGFAVLQKKVNTAFLTLEGGVNKNLSDENVNFEFGLGSHEKFGILTLKSGLVWNSAWSSWDSTKEFLMHPMVYFGIELTLDLVKR